MKRILALLILGFGITSMAAANSHSSFVTSTPVKNSTVKELPAEVRIQFDQDLLVIGEENPNRVEIINPNNQKISGESSVAGPFVYAPITNQEAIAGDYTVNYRIASADGHVVTGTYQFSIAGEEVVAINETPVAEEPVVTEHHENFFIHHLEHIIWALLFLAFIGLWALLRFRK